MLAQAAIGAFGKGKVVNVGARNDAFGTALEQLFVAQYKKLGGKVGQTLRWNPDQANFDTEAGRLVSGNPAGYVIIDFPETFEKFAPSLVRTGKWEASRTFMTEALRNEDVLKGIGARSKGCAARRPRPRAHRHEQPSMRSGSAWSRARSRTPASRGRRSTRRTSRSSRR